MSILCRGISPTCCAISSMTRNPTSAGSWKPGLRNLLLGRLGSIRLGLRSRFLDDAVVPPAQYDWFVLLPQGVSILCNLASDLHIIVVSYREQLPALRCAAGGNADNCRSSRRLARVLVEELRSLAIPFQFGHIPNIVQREGVVGIESISLPEILVGGAQVIAIDRRNTSQVQFCNLF